MRVTDNGNTLRLYINGFPKLEVNDSTSFGANHITFQNSNNSPPTIACIDNVLVEELGGDCPVDSDGDGIPDDEDECPDSDLSDVIVIDGCDTGVENQMLEDGCTMADLIAQCADGVSDHGAFARCVAHLTNFWKCNGLINGGDKGDIQSCAGQADIP